jgi:hypothetical protein
MDKAKRRMKIRLNRNRMKRRAMKPQRQAAKKEIRDANKYLGT